MGPGGSFVVRNGTNPPPHPAILEARHRLQSLLCELGMNESQRTQKKEIKRVSLRAFHVKGNEYQQRRSGECETTGEVAKTVERQQIRGTWFCIIRRVVDDGKRELVGEILEGDFPT